MQFQRGANRALRIVAARHRHAEDGDHLVAHELVDVTAVTLDNGNGLTSDACDD